MEDFHPSEMYERELQWRIYWTSIANESWLSFNDKVVSLKLNKKVWLLFTTSRLSVRESWLNYFNENVLSSKTSLRKLVYILQIIRNLLFTAQVVEKLYGACHQLWLYIQKDIWWEYIKLYVKCRTLGSSNLLIEIMNIEFGSWTSR